MTAPDRLPPAAWVEEKKIKEYLLNESHPQGGPKARFFLARGFAADAWQAFRDALVVQANTNPVVRVVETEFGTRYTVDCSCPTPDQQNPCIRSVWEVAESNPTPRLITAHPLTK